MSSEPVLVYIRISNGESIGDVFRSILAQQDIDLEIVVVDDASADAPATSVAATQDPRIRLVRNEQPLGATRCREIALGLSTARFVAECPPRGEVLPGALRKLVDACATDSKTGLAHAYWFEADHHGRLSRAQFRARRALLLAMDARCDLLRRGDVLSPLRVFRREALETALHSGPSDSELAVLLRIADRYELALVPEYLFSARPAPARDLADSLREIRSTWQEHRRSGGLFAACGYRVPALLLGRLGDALGLRRFSARATRWAEVAGRAIARAFRAPLERLYYARIGRSGSRLPEVPLNEAADRRIAYYLWHFPVLSQTFVNRELAALQAAGIQVDIVADEPEDLALIDHNARSLLPYVLWLLPPKESRLARARRYFCSRHPLRYARMLLFLMTCRYTGEKRFRTDRKVLAQAVSLAWALREKGTTHVHAPWADRCALVALVASRLLGISFSFQARAHELHRHTYRYGVRPLLEPAAFVVTNTRYNESHLRALLGADERGKIHVIPNGIDLDRFEPRARAPGSRTRLLCVARLIEQKGLIHLLEACRQLLDRGVDLSCEIVGGPEEPLYIKYHLELKKMHRRLALGDRVQFRGTLPFHDVLDCYRESDLFVLPCVIASDGTRDIIPNSLLEAMAMGLPAVTTTIGGIPEMVEHGESGLIVSPGDSAALADAIEGLIRDPERAAALGAAARRRIEEKFDIRRNVQGFVDLFSGNGRPRQATGETNESAHYPARPSPGRADSRTAPAMSDPSEDRTPSRSTS